MLHFARKFLFSDGKVDQLYILWMCEKILFCFSFSAVYVYNINIKYCLKYLEYHLLWVCFNHRENPDPFWKLVIFHDKVYYKHYFLLSLENCCFRREKSVNRKINLFWFLLHFVLVCFSKNNFYLCYVNNLDTLDKDELNMDSEDGGSLEQHCSPLSWHTFVHSLYLFVLNGDLVRIWLSQHILSQCVLCSQSESQIRALLDEFSSKTYWLLSQNISQTFGRYFIFFMWLAIICVHCCGNQLDLFVLML